MYTNPLLSAPLAVSLSDSHMTDNGTHVLFGAGLKSADLAFIAGFRDISKRFRNI